jgi:hypothetical protein
MSRQEMYKVITENYDMQDLGTTMFEAIYSTIEEMQKKVGLDVWESSDEEFGEFTKALWTALFVANT